MLSVTLWVSVAAYWLENRNFALDSLRVLVLPCAAVAVVLPALFPGELASLEQKSPLFSWHVAIAMLAYSTLTIAAFHAVLMALQESRLHIRPGESQHSWFGAAIDRLPALLTMEKLLFRMVAFGFVLLSLTVLSGVVFSEQLFGLAFKWDHKTVFTMMSWVLFGALLAGRQWRGWRGKMALRFFLSGFVALLLGYVGSRFVFEVVLHRAFLYEIFDLVGHWRRRRDLDHAGQPAWRTQSRAVGREKGRKPEPELPNGCCSARAAASIFRPRKH